MIQSMATCYKIRYEGYCLPMIDDSYFQTTTFSTKLEAEQRIHELTLQSSLQLAFIVSGLSGCGLTTSKERIEQDAKDYYKEELNKYYIVKCIGNQEEDDY